MKTTIEIPECEYEIISKIAKALGTTTQALIQQEVNEIITTISVWVQRANLTIQ
jgi:hypothetical protein